MAFSRGTWRPPPADLEDFGVGFSLSEGFVTEASAIRNVVALTVENGFCVDIAVDEAALKPRSVRALEGRTGSDMLIMQHDLKANETL